MHACMGEWEPYARSLHLDGESVSELMHPNDGHGLGSLV